LWAFAAVDSLQMLDPNRGALKLQYKMTSAMVCLSWCIVISSALIVATALEKPPEPPVWPETFHAVAVQNRNGSLALVDLYYEWKKGRNANLIHSQLGTTLHDIE
jgi:hypothetical protein